MGKFESRDEDIQSNDWRAYFDSSCLRVWHLTGKDRTFKIVRVTRLTSEMISGNKREVKKQPKLELEDAKGNPVPLPLLLNKTNAKTIAQLYGNNPAGWVGKSVTLFPSTTSVGGEEKECVRVRPQVPGKGASRSRQAPAQAPAPPTIDHESYLREPGQDDEEPPPGALESDRASH